MTNSVQRIRNKASATWRSRAGTPIVIRRYERSLEVDSTNIRSDPDSLVPFPNAPDHLNRSGLSTGSIRLLLGLLRTGTTRVFPGGGIGIEYGSLLKTAARPDDVGEHVQEVAEHLRDKRV